MKNVKKLLALGLAVTMTASMLTGCGSSNDGAADADAKTDAATDTAADTAADTEASAEGGSVYYLNFTAQDINFSGQYSYTKPHIHLNTSKFM